MTIRRPLLELLTREETESIVGEACRTRETVGVLVEHGPEFVKGGGREEPHRALGAAGRTVAGVIARTAEEPGTTPS